MKKKFLAIAILFAVFSFALVSYTFAANGMDKAVNDVRNFVGGAENVVEDAGKGAVDGIRDGINTIGNGANDVARDVENGMNNGGDNRQSDDNMGTTGTMGTGNGYTATRTSTDSGNGAAGFLGNVSNNVWTWLIIAIVGIVIVALIMYYAKQSNITTYNNDDDNE